MIESILKDAVKHAREILQAKTVNKYYFDDDILKEKGRYKEILYGEKMIDHKRTEFNKMRTLLTSLCQKEYDIENKTECKNDIYRSMYEGIMYGGRINEQRIKKRNKIRTDFRKQEEYANLYRRDETERMADNNRELYNYMLKNKKRLLSGNCPDYCSCAFHYLINNRIDDILNFFNNSSETSNHIYIQIVVTLGIYDHAFITIGCFNYNVFKPILGRLYHDLPKGLWVCDPWANIVCRAEKYNDMWKNKMDKWHYMGKCLILGENNEQATFPSIKNHSPLNKNTYLTIQNSVKKVCSLAVISPDKNVIIKAS
ncbi:MAG: hypothetical protein LBI71_01915 [Enterobacteriaceae bacterium]|jgi:hypothetical protein|nr:hypothetical protein [Enterobacteriaceae bacterium]